MVKTIINKYYAWIFLILLIILAFLIIKPFINAILTAAVFAYLFYPLHKKLRKLINKTASALIVTLIIIIIIFVPLAFIANSLVKESAAIINLGFKENIIIEKLTQSELLSKYTSEIIKVSTEYIKKQASSFILSIAHTLLSILISTITIFYFILIGEKLILRIREALPIKKKDELLKHIGDSVYSIVYGSFATALILFIIALVGFKLLNVNNPFIFSLIIGISVFIPLIGPAAVWLPLAIFKYIQEFKAEAVGVIILGLVISSIEFFIKPKIIGHKSKIHPIIIIIGIIGGIKIFNFIGLVVGPIILSALIAIIEEYFPLKDET